MICRIPAMASLFAAVALADSPAEILTQLDVPAKGNQKPYSPADRQEVAVSPPPFIWVPVQPPARYQLQISRSTDFAADQTRTFSDLPNSVFVPREPIGPGEWFWRYGVQTDEGNVFGRPRPFIVPPNARPFPFPDFDQVMARVPRSRPRLFFPGEHLERIRRAANHGLQDEMQELLKECRHAVGRELVAEPPKPKSGPESVHVMRTTRPPMDDMERCGLAWLITGDVEIGAEAKRRILHFFSWDPNGPTGLWGYDEPAMWMMMRGVRAYDWTYPLFSAQERARLEPVMKERARQFYVHLKERRRFETNPYESHSGRMPGFLGEAALCFAHEWPEAQDWLEYATLLYYTSYPAWGGDDGGWQEGPGYWSAYMRFALHYVVALQRATGIDLMKKPFFRNTPYYALYTATPYHEFRPFGDGANGNAGDIAPVLYAFSSLLQDPYLRWHYEESDRSIGSSVLNFAVFDSTLEPANPRNLPHGRVFHAVGLAALHTALGDRENDISFLLRSSPFGSVSHGHADQNAFVIEAFGRGLALATGYYPWYGSPHHHQWTRDTRAVNSILVDGGGQVRRSWDAKGRITAFQLGDGYDYVECEAGQAYGDRLKRFRRHVVHVQAGTFVVFDDLIARKPAIFQWLLHAADRIEIANQKLTVRRPPAVMDVHLLVPRDVKITQTDRYSPEPESVSDKPADHRNTWHLSASTSRPDSAAAFLAVLSVRREGADPARLVERVAGEGAIGVRLIGADGRADVVCFRTGGDAARVTCGSLSSEAAVFAEGRSPEGKIMRRLAVPVARGPE